MADTEWCRLGQHSWECYSGDTMICIECDTYGTVTVNDDQDD